MKAKCLTFRASYSRMAGRLARALLVCVGTRQCSKGQLVRLSFGTTCFLFWCATGSVACAASRPPPATLQSQEPHTKRIDPEVRCDARLLRNFTPAVGEIVERRSTVKVVKGQPLAYSERVVCNDLAHTRCHIWANEYARSRERRAGPGFGDVEVREALGLAHSVEFDTAQRHHVLVYTDKNQAFREILAITAREGPLRQPVHSVFQQAGRVEAKSPELFVDHYFSVREMTVPAATWVYEVEARRAVMNAALSIYIDQDGFVVEQDSLKRATRKVHAALPPAAEYEIVLSDDKNAPRMSFELEVFCPPHALET